MDMNQIRGPQMPGEGPGGFCDTGRASLGMSPCYMNMGACGGRVHGSTEGRCEFRPSSTLGPVLPPGEKWNSTEGVVQAGCRNTLRW